MEEKEGTGDGECGNLMCMMGKGWVLTVMAGGAEWVLAGWEGNTGCEESYSVMIGAEVESEGMTP